jgi:hypothetical protein
VVPRYVATGLAAVAAFAACKSPSIALGDLDTEALRSRCERYVRCGLFTDQDSCEGFFRIVVDVDRQPSINAGLVHYDGEAAESCYSALAGLTCDGTSRAARVPPADCSKIFVGTIGDGDACENDLECKSGRCHLDAAACGSSSCCSGTCGSSTLAKAGDACIDSTDCVADTYCGTDDVCHALGQSGAPCYIDAECEYSLRCSGTAPATTCEPAGTLGNACPSGQCAEIGSACNASGMCVAAGLPGQNAGCTSDSECSMFALCAMNICVAYPTLGMPCDTHGCASDAYCNVMANPAVCTALLDDLMPCSFDADCASDYCYEGPAFDDCEERPVCK